MRRVASIITVLVLVLFAGVGLAEKIPNWPAPPTWSPEISGGWLTKSVISDLSGPLPFIPITPCRLADTRAGSGFPAGYGPPSIAGGGTQRTFTITGQCGIPTGAAAVSFNFAVWGPPTRGDLRVFPAGGATPLVSTLNWEAGILALANAAVVPLGAGGAITLQVDGAGTVDIFFDVNGYYSTTPANQNNYFSLTNNSTTYTMSLLNNSTTCSGPCGLVVSVLSGNAVQAYADGTGINQYGVVGVAGSSAGVKSAGVTGLNNSATGIQYGVRGVGNTNTMSAGVLGTDGSFLAPDDLSESAGVHGWGKTGVAGTTSSAGFYGVMGMKLINSTTLGPYGMLGFSTYGMYAAGDTGASGTKSFVEPHPTDASKVIKFVSLEGPESGTYFRGKAETKGGVAVIEVPDCFRIVTDEDGMTVHVTPVGHYAQVWVENADLGRIVVRSSRDVTIHYIVHGVRRAFKEFVPVQDGEEFIPRSADGRIPAYLTDEAKRRLIANGTYNADGTVNMLTAERLGWVQRWEERAKAVPGPKVSAAPSNR